MARKIYIFDTTLRDGEQTPGVNLNVNEKLEIARQLEKLGVDAIEAGFPIASNGDFEGVKAIAKNIRKPYIVALARATKGDIDRAYLAIKEAAKPRIHTFIATSDIHMEYKLKMTEDEVYARAVEMVAYAKSLCGSVEFSPEDGSRSRPLFLYRVLEGVIEAGADVLNIPDTVGYSTPTEFGNLIAGIKKNVKNIDKAIISVHCHNDLGLAVANSLAALENGADQLECTINGLGERAGNAALEELVMAIKTRKDYFKDIDISINTEELSKVSSLVSHMTGVQIQPNKAIVGANAFAHESGIHQHGVLNNKETYEIMTPESIGLKANQMVLGKHSGRHAFEEKLKEIGYINLSSEKLNEAFIKFKDLADKKKKVSDRDIEVLVMHEAFRNDEKFKLVSLHTLSGNNTTPTATVKLKIDDIVKEEVAIGDGPVNATFNAIEKALNLDIVLNDFYLKAIGSGKDALGEVTVRINYKEKIYSGIGISTDIIESSANAYINAINKIDFTN